MQASEHLRNKGMDPDRLCGFFNRLQALLDYPARQGLQSVVQALRHLEAAKPGAQFGLVRDGTAAVILRLRRLPDSDRYALLQAAFGARDIPTLVRALDDWLEHRPKPLDPRVQAVLAAVQVEYRSPAKCRLACLSRSVTLSPWHLSKLIHKETGRHLADHVRQARVDEAARRLIAAPARPLRRIAQDVGYKDETDLCHAFRLVTGCSPRQYIRLSQTIPGPSPP